MTHFHSTRLFQYNSQERFFFLSSASIKMCLIGRAQFYVQLNEFIFLPRQSWKTNWVPRWPRVSGFTRKVGGGRGGVGSRRATRLLHHIPTHFPLLWGKQDVLPLLWGWQRFFSFFEECKAFFPTFFEVGNPPQRYPSVSLNLSLYFLSLFLYSYFIYPLLSVNQYLQTTIWISL